MEENSNFKLSDYDLYKLLGKSILGEEFQHILTTFPAHLRKEIKNYTYVNYMQDGISFCFLNNSLDSYILYNENIHGYKQFKGKLPYNLKWTYVNKNIVEFFGDTKSKGGGTIPIWLAYDKLGLMITFLGKLWNDTENPITHMQIYKKNIEEEEFCSTCLKPVKDGLSFICPNKCLLVQYCSENCMKMHINYHLKFCS